MAKSVSQIISETVNPPKSGDERRFMKKHVVDVIDYPVPQVDAPAEKKMAQAKRDADLADDEDELVYEGMTDAQMKKREEIVKSMKANTSDFKKRYGDKWKEVMYATANKTAMKEEVSLMESVAAGSLKLNDGSTVTISKDDASKLTSLFSQLNGENKKKMETRMKADKKGFGEILSFAKETV